MATILRDAQSDQYHIRFRFAGRAFKRSLKTDQKSEAAASLARLTETISLVRRGVLDLPAEADPVTFLLTGGRKGSVPISTTSLTLGQLFTKYQSELPEQAKETNTLKTETTHIKIFRKKKKLPLSKTLDQLTTNDIQQFINSESRRKYGGRPLSPDTVTFKEQLPQVKDILRKLAGKLEIKNADERKQVKTHQAVLHGEEFKALWSRIKHKTTYRVQFDNEKLIAECTDAIRKAPPIAKTRLQWRKSAKIECGKAHFKALETGANPARFVKASKLDDLLGQT